MLVLQQQQPSRRRRPPRLCCCAVAAVVGFLPPQLSLFLLLSSSSFRRPSYSSFPPVAVVVVVSGFESTSSALNANYNYFNNNKGPLSKKAATAIPSFFQARAFATATDDNDSNSNNNNSRMLSRRISQLVPSVGGEGSPIRRLIGTVDVDGAGTAHALERQADPFLLLDYATLEKDNMPPFGPHPHRGHSVVTLLLRGRVKSWDSFSQKETVVRGPASYWADAGSGIFHDETTVIEDENDPAQHVELYQLWVCNKEEDRLAPPKAQYETELPVVEARNQADEVVGTIRYYVGGGGDAKGKNRIETPHPITVAHVFQKPGSTFRVPIDADCGGFVVPTEVHGELTFAGSTTVTSEQVNDVLVLETSSSDGDGDDDEDDRAGDYLEVATSPSSSSSSSYLVCTGERIGEPWSKKLVASGAVIARTPEEARDIAAKVEGYAAAGKQQGGGGSYAPFGK